MEQYIPKAAVMAKIERTQKILNLDDCGGRSIMAWSEDFKNFLNTLEVKEVVEYKQPDYSYLETTYHCGKNPHWNIGDTLAYYEFCSDIEGEHVLGKVTKIEFDKEQCDWFYTFERGSVYDEQSLLEEQTYKKN